MDGFLLFHSCALWSLVPSGHAGELMWAGCTYPAWATQSLSEAPLDSGRSFSETMQIVCVMGPRQSTILPTCSRHMDLTSFPAHCGELSHSSSPVAHAQSIWGIPRKPWSRMTYTTTNSSTSALKNSSPCAELNWMKSEGTHWGTLQWLQKTCCWESHHTGSHGVYNLALKMIPKEGLQNCVWAMSMGLQ